MARIKLEGMEFYSNHGCFDEERIIGTFFRVDLEIETDTEKAQHTDNLTDTVDYSAIYQIVKQEMDKPSKLLEHVAERVLTAVLKNYPSVDVASIKVSKLNPPLGGKMSAVSVSISKSR